MLRYRIYTEDRKSVSGVFESPVDYVAYTKEFPGMIVYNAQGYWSGIGESLVIIEIMTQSRIGGEKIYGIAREIKQAFDQESVLVTEDIVNETFI